MESSNKRTRTIFNSATLDIKDKAQANHEISATPQPEYKDTTNFVRLESPHQNKSVTLSQSGNLPPGKSISSKSLLYFGIAEVKANLELNCSNYDHLNFNLTTENCNMSVSTDLTESNCMHASVVTTFTVNDNNGNDVFEGLNTIDLSCTDMTQNEVYYEEIRTENTVKVESTNLLGVDYAHDI